MLNNNLSYFFAKVVPTKRIRLGRPGSSLKMGLLGMSNIGKSSTFNFLSKMNVPAQNIPFCTIQPNTAFISIKDQRFEQLCELYRPQKVSGPVIRIVDIAGLVKGASEGYGLGNEFLSHVSEVDGLYHVVRAFQSDEIAHTEGGMDSVRDIKIIRHQLLQKDKDQMNKKVTAFGKKAAKSQDNKIRKQYQMLQKIENCLKQNIEIRNKEWIKEEIQILNQCNLLTSKPMIYLLNLSKEDYLSNNIANMQKIEQIVTYNGMFNEKIIPYSASYQKEILDLPVKEKSQIDNIIKSGYEELQLIHFFTTGVDEVRAWAIRAGQTAVDAGGKIHSDFTRGFINAEVIHSTTLLKNPTFKEKLAKNSKKQGKAYIVKDGDIVHFNSKIK